MAKGTERKGMGWFKDIMNNPNSVKDHNNEELHEITSNQNEVHVFSSETEEEQLSSNNFQDPQDKLSMDLMNSIEKILKDRQLLSYKNKGLEEQLQSSNETIYRLNQDILKKEQFLDESQNVIQDLESKLTNKQMGYDQLIEDYKAYQLSSKTEYEKISNRLETEISKYIKLSDDYSNNQQQNMLKVNGLEDKIRKLEIENQKLIEQYEKIDNEKAQLMETINDFTERMSFSFSTKSSSDNL